MNPEIIDYIRSMGGKAAILNYIHRQNPDLPIPKYVLLRYDELESHIRNDFDSMRKPVIVRSSSPYEYADFEGIFTSVKGVSDWSSLQEGVFVVRESAKSERAKKYAIQNGFTIDEEIHCIIQEQSPSKYVGSMLRHPNNPSKLYIQLYFGKQIDCVRTAVVYDCLKERIERTNDIDLQIDERTAKELAALYKSVENTRVDPEYSLIIEFGLEPLALYQARPFKKVEQANFKISNAHKSILSPNYVLGITPPEGIVLPVVRTLGITDAADLAFQLKFEEAGEMEYISLRQEYFNDYERLFLTNRLLNIIDAFNIRTSLELTQDCQRRLEDVLVNWHKDIERRMKGDRYCLLLSSPQGNRYDIDLTLPNVGATINGMSDFFLVHDLTRLVKKSEVSLFCENLMTADFFREARSLEKKVRLVSNGRESYVFKE